MKRIIFTSFSLLLLSALTATAVKAETRQEFQRRANLGLAEVTPVLDIRAEMPLSQPGNLQAAMPMGVGMGAVLNQPAPVDLVFLAYHGYLKAQSIPSAGRLVDAHRSGMLHAKDLVQAAIQAQRLPAAALEDRGYVNAVENTLKFLEND
jgi:hypothetical protein